jgi:hypothetical protein
MFASLDNEDSPTCVVCGAALDPEGQHFSRCRLCSELMTANLVTITATPDSPRCSSCGCPVPKYRTVCLVCIDISYSTKGRAYWAELVTEAMKTLDRLKPGGDYLAS